MQLSFYNNFIGSLTAQEARINTLQQQISTGVTVQTPDQNPGVYEKAALGENQISQLENDNTAQASIQSQLGAASAAYGSLTSLLSNVQSTVLQALNGTTNAAGMHALATQIQSNAQNLLSLSNTVGPNGEYLFAGSRGSVAPFQTNASGEIVYYGDSGQSQATISPGGTANTLVNGEVFASSLAGDGISSITAAAGNTGSGQMLQQGVVNAAAANAFQQGNAPITVSFAVSGATTTYTATQGGSPIATGTLDPNSQGQTTVQLAGANFAITGNPANGDSFTLSPSRPQSAFDLLNQIASALAGAGSTPAQMAQTHQILNQGLASLEQLQQNVTTAQAQNGVTLQALADAATGNTAQQTATQTAVESATATDMPAAISTLTQTMTALQAAMQTFGAAQKLTLFNYL